MATYRNRISTNNLDQLTRRDYHTILQDLYAYRDRETIVQFIAKDTEEVVSFFGKDWYRLSEELSFFNTIDKEL